MNVVKFHARYDRYNYYRATTIGTLVQYKLLKSCASNCQIVRTIAVCKSCIFSLCHHPVQNIKNSVDQPYHTCHNLAYFISEFWPLLPRVYVRKRENIKCHAYIAVQMCKL